ncbi:hypothetical protein E5161_04105 [Cohnella pontilimi]|uniref:Glycosyltransferase family 1 protein n=1 Tax=Cohnella pontilimi TaxID=2564100 RepID=A0A4U0FE80_9BACL|nr:hypothetical protein [Cohnella pontilimi]TJY43088.1 hypothetical protein E5161_04105 [Cohnella pontilimi]
MKILRAYEAGNAQAHLISRGLFKANQEMKVWDEKPPQDFQPFDIFHVHGASAAASRLNDWLLNRDHARAAPLIQYETAEIRSRHAATRSNFYAYLADDYQEEDPNLLAQLSSVFPACIVNNAEAAEYAAKYHQRVYIVPCAIHPENLGEIADGDSDVSGNPVVIVHFVKESNGSEYVEKAISRLRQEGYEIQYEPSEGLDHTDAVALMKRADIVIDQLLHGTYGIISAQAMALGKVVLSHIREDLKPKMDPDLPVISANPATLYRELIPLIHNIEWRQHLRDAGRKYAEKNHFVDAVTAKLLRVYRAELGWDPDWEPVSEPQVELQPEPQMEPQLAQQWEPQMEPQPEPHMEMKVEPQVEHHVELPVETYMEPHVEPQMEPPVDTELVVSGDVLHPPWNVQPYEANPPQPLAANVLTDLPVMKIPKQASRSTQNRVIYPSRYYSKKWSRRKSASYFSFDLSKLSKSVSVKSAVMILPVRMHNYRRKISINRIKRAWSTKYAKTKLPAVYPKSIRRLSIRRFCRSARLNFTKLVRRWHQRQIVNYGLRTNQKLPRRPRLLVTYRKVKSRLHLKRAKLVNRKAFRFRRNG